MVDAPLISIVVPSLNQGRFLEACLRSVIEQKYPRFELIVMDGGSTDESVAIIQKYANRLAYWVSEKDAGQSAAINRGMDRAQGELVSWLNSDDLLLPNALATAARAWQEHPQAAFIYGNAAIIDEAGATRDYFRPRKLAPVWRRDAMLYALNFVPQPAAFIPRAHWREVGGLDESLRWGMDSDLWLKLSAKREPVPIAASLAAMRQHDASKTSTGGFDRVEELRRIAQRHGAGEITPGGICYLLHTLSNAAERDQRLYDWPFRKSLGLFWNRAANLLAVYGADTCGHPLFPARRDRDGK